MEAQLVGSDLLKEGWLTKEAVGKKGLWRQRYFIFRNNALYYYEDKPKNPAKEKPKGVVELSTKSVVRPSAVQKNYAFEVYTKPLLLRMCATNQMEANQWVAVLREAVENLKELEASRGGVREHKMEGFLVKRAMSSGRNWKKRWFVLKGGRVAYYEERPKPGSNERPKGVMELTPDTVVITFKDSQTAKPNCFEVTAKKLVLTVSADTPESMRDWVSALDQQILAKAGLTSEGSIEVCKWLRAAGLQEYAKRMVDLGCDELATLWDMKPEAVTEMGDKLEMSRMEKDQLEEAYRILKKSKKPKSHKEVAKKEAPKVAAVLFDRDPPPPGKQTRLYTWGDSTNGSLGLVQSRAGDHVHTPTWIDSLKGKTEPGFLACGSAAMGIITNGPEANLFTWGTGPLGLGADRINSGRPFKCMALADTPIKQLACGAAHMVAVSRDGEVFAWGAGDCGQLGMGETIQGLGTPQLVPGVGPRSTSAIAQCAAGAEHTILISTQGAVFAFGKGESGQLGLPTTSNVFVPTRLRALDGHPMGQAACGDEFTLTISQTGSAAYWFGLVRDEKVTAPERMARFTTRTISQCAAGGKTGMFLVGLSKDTRTGEFGTDSSVYSFGSDVWVHGHGDDEPKLKPTLMDSLEGHGVVQMSVSATHAAVLTADGNLLTWGRDTCGQLGSSYMVSIKRPAEAIRISGYRYTKLCVGQDFTAAIAYEDATCLEEGIPAGEPGTAPPPPDEALEAQKGEEDQLQGLLDQFAVFAHNHDLMNTEPPMPDDEDDDLSSIPPPPPPPASPPKPTSSGGVRVLPPGSKDLGNGWLSHTDKATGKVFYEHPASGKVQWSAPKA